MELFSRYWLSRWPWMSISSLRISFMSDRETMRWSILAVLFPEEVISLVNTVSSFTSNPASSITDLACASFVRSKVPSTMALGLSLATYELLALSALKRERASINMDFPAPVSPTNAENPGSKSRFTSSISTKSLMYRCLIISSSLIQNLLNLLI